MTDRTITLKAAVGESVFVPELEIRAVVLSVTINPGGATYEVAYFNGGERKFANLFPHEFRLATERDRKPEGQ